jgi:nitrate/nitrite transporter NarK
MKEGNSKFDIRSRILPLFLLAGSCGVFNVLYLAVVFYVPFQNAFGFTNTEMGTLLAFYSMVGTPALILCGVLTDRWNPKTMLVLACIGSGLCALWLSTIPDYGTTKLIMAILAIPAGLLQWSPYTKCVGLMGDNSEQGRLFGLASVFDGLISLLLFVGLASIFGNAIGTRENFSIVILIFGIFYVLVGLGILFFYDYKKWEALNGSVSSSEKKKLTAKDLLLVFKTPLTWIAGIMIMGSYMASTCLTYLSPYLNSIYIMPVGLAAAFGAITRYAVKIVASPLGGTLRDLKLGGSTSKLVWLATGCVIIFTGGLLILPKESRYLIPAVIIALLIIFSFRLNNTSESSVFRQLSKTPFRIIGTIVGVASFVGYSSDLFLPRIIGSILDTQGNGGYKYIFMILILSMLISSAGGVALFKLYKKEQKELKEELSTSG